jgi:uncharacterized protein YjiS (DUF1127 family)
MLQAAQTILRSRWVDALPRASLADLAGALPRPRRAFARMVEAMERRRARAQLEALDEHLRRDIGLDPLDGWRRPHR